MNENVVAGIFGFLILLALVTVVVQAQKIKNWPRGEEAPKSEELPSIFTATLFDIKKHPVEILDTFSFSISRPSGREDINDIALNILKGRDTYKKNDDVQALVSFIEFGGETAGHEFDVLPEALRRVRFDVRPLEILTNGSGGYGCGGCSGSCEGNCDCSGH